MCCRFNIDSSNLNHFTVSRYLRSITINSAFSPTPPRIFDIKTLYHISLACDSFPDPLLYRAIFLMAFFAFLRMSNITPHSARLFHQDTHILRQYVTFKPPGACILIKWTKTLQDYRSHHIVQLPTIQNVYLCPVQALKALLASRVLPPTASLFANNFPPYAQVIDTHIRDALKAILRAKGIPTTGHGFHTFRRSGATLAFDNNVPLQNIIAHGLWKSSSVWTYLQNASLAPSIIPSTFSSVIPPHF